MMEVGQTFELPFQFSQDQVDQFALVTGDDNPLHLDAAYAAGTLFKRPIMHGFLSASVFSRIFGTLFPGEGTIYLSQNLRFLRPMFVEEPYRAVVEVVEADPEKHLARIQTEIKDNQGKTTISGEALLLNQEKI